MSDGNGRIDPGEAIKWEQSVAYYQAQLDTVEAITIQFLEPLREATHKEGFYKGELVEDEKFLEELKNAVNINLVGENTISLAKDSGFVNDVKTIKSVPYALVFKL